MNPLRSMNHLRRSTGEGEECVREVLRVPRGAARMNIAAGWIRVLPGQLSLSLAHQDLKNPPRDHLGLQVSNKSSKVCIL